MHLWKTKYIKRDLYDSTTRDLGYTTRPSLHSFLGVSNTTSLNYLNVGRQKTFWKIVGEFIQKQILNKSALGYLVIGERHLNIGKAFQILVSFPKGGLTRLICLIGKYFWF